MATSKIIITISFLLMVFNGYSSEISSLKFPTPVARWADDEWDFEEFLKGAMDSFREAKKRAQETIEDLTTMFDVEASSCSDSKTSSNSSESLQSTIKLTPVPTKIEIADKDLSRAPLRRDLCKIWYHMQVLNKTTFSFVSEYRVIKHPQESYALFAYSKALLENNIFTLKAQFNNKTIMHLDYNLNDKKWNCSIYSDNICNQDKVHSDMDNSAI